MQSKLGTKYFSLVLASIKRLFHAKADLALENLALRQQLAMYARERPRPRPSDTDRASATSSNAGPTSSSSSSHLPSFVGTNRQNPVGERWIQTLRRELLDHIIVLGDKHLVRVARSYIAYYNEDRCHSTLEGDTPQGRPIQKKPSRAAQVVALPRVGGLHHRYLWQKAA